MKKKPITEKDNYQLEWYKEGRNQTLGTLPEFLKGLVENYSHDYGTICHAMTAAALAAMWAVDKSDQGGITGFQASCIMWEFIKQWDKSNNKAGLKMIDYDYLLYPQYEEKFEKTISSDQWGVIQKEANKNLEENTQRTHPDVISHWQSISDGEIPFGFRIAK